MGPGCVIATMIFDVAGIGILYLLQMVFNRERENGIYSELNGLDVAIGNVITWTIWILVATIAVKVVALPWIVIRARKNASEPPPLPPNWSPKPPNRDL